MRTMATAEVTNLATAEDAPQAPSCAEIYEENFEFVWRNARRMGVEESACEDVVHEVFVVAIRRISGFEGRSSVRTWLYGILVHVVQEHRRKRKQRLEKETEANLDRPSQDGPAEELAKKEA